MLHFKCHVWFLPHSQLAPTVPEYLENFNDKTRDHLQTSLSIVKSLIFTDHGKRCLFSLTTLPLKRAAKEKRNSRAETSACKKHWITTIHVCPILGPLPAWLCAKLTFILKSGFILSVGEHEAMALSPTHCSKKGQLHQFDWGAVEKDEGFSTE